jgi:hypothetical protein
MKLYDIRRMSQLFSTSNLPTLLNLTQQTSPSQLLAALIPRTINNPVSHPRSESISEIFSGYTTPIRRRAVSTILY